LCVIVLYVEKEELAFRRIPTAKLVALKPVYRGKKRNMENVLRVCETVNRSLISEPGAETKTGQNKIK
jgi:hypothetical protein